MKQSVHKVFQFFKIFRKSSKPTFFNQLSRIFWSRWNFSFWFFREHVDYLQKPCLLSYLGPILFVSEMGQIFFCKISNQKSFCKFSSEILFLSRNYFIFYTIWNLYFDKNKVSFLIIGAISSLLFRTFCAKLSWIWAR